MKYYKVDDDSNPKVVGSDSSQSWQFTKEYKKRTDNPNSVYALNEYIYKEHRRPCFVPDLDGFKLSGRAKMTNFITSVVCRSPLIDEKAKEVLQSKCNFGDHEFYEATLYVREEPVKVYYLAIFYDLDSKIRYKDCRYSIWGSCIKSEEDLPIEWKEGIPIESRDYICKIEQRYSPWATITCHTLVLDKSFDKDMDLFYYLGMGIRYWICTERFKNAVDEAGLTGLVFEPIEVEIEE